jgi:hypothetical protein
VPLTPAERIQAHKWAKSNDPGANPAILMVYSALADAEAIEKLGRVLRDPRNGVRAGAITAVRRLALSGAPGGREELAAALAGWLSGGKLPADITVELVRLIGEIGIFGVDAELRAAASTGRPHAAAVEEAFQRLRIRAQPESWQGLWLSDGLDVFEPGEPSAVRSWVVIHPVEEGLMWAAANGSQRFALPLGPGPIRMVWAPRQGSADRFVAIQKDGATWWRQDAKELATAVDDLLTGFDADDASTLDAIAGWLEPVEGTLATRARALVAWRAGESERARVLLEELAGHKRPRADIFWWLGRVNADLGRKAEAIAAIDEFLERSGKRAEFRTEAEALKASLIHP